MILSAVYADSDTKISRLYAQKAYSLFSINPQSAYEFALNSLEFNEFNSDALFILVKLEGFTDRTFELCEKAVNDDNWDFFPREECLSFYLQLLYDKHKYEDYIRVYKKAIKIPEDIRFENYYLYSLFKTGEEEEAGELASWMIKDNPYNIDPYLLLIEGNSISANELYVFLKKLNLENPNHFNHFRRAVLGTSDMGIKKAILKNIRNWEDFPVEIIIEAVRAGMISKTEALGILNEDKATADINVIKYIQDTLIPAEENETFQAAARNIFRYHGDLVLQEEGGVHYYSVDNNEVVSWRIDSDHNEMVDIEVIFTPDKTADALHINYGEKEAVFQYSEYPYLEKVVLNDGESILTNYFYPYNTRLSILEKGKVDLGKEVPLIDIPDSEKLEDILEKGIRESVYSLNKRNYPVYKKVYQNDKITTFYDTRDTGLFDLKEIQEDGFVFVYKDADLDNYFEIIEIYSGSYKKYFAGDMNDNKIPEYFIFTDEFSRVKVWDYNEDRILDDFIAENRDDGKKREEIDRIVEKFYRIFDDN